MHCCIQGNTTLWILVALLVLGGNKDGLSCNGIFNGCSLPIIVALLYCLYKNGTLASILTPHCNCTCNCNCCCD